MPTRSTTNLNSVEPVENSVQTSITLAVGDDQIETYQLLLTAFESEQEQIKVQVVGINELQSENGGNTIEAVTQRADVFQVSGNLIQNTAFALNLKPLIEADPDFDVGDFLPGLIDTSSATIWMLPTSAEYPMIFYDGSAFTESGLAYPEPGWTLDEFLTAAQTLTRQDNGEVSRWGYVPNSLRGSPLLATQLVAPLIQNGIPRFTDSDVIAASQWMVDLFTRHQVTPWLASYKPQDRHGQFYRPEQWDLMGSGQAAMWQREHSWWQTGNFQENVAVTTIPRSVNGYAADPLVGGFAISRGTLNADAAWQLINFLSRQPPTTPSEWYLVPARRSVAVTMNYWETVPSELKNPLQYAIENNVLMRLPPESAPIVNALVDMIENGTPAETALASAQTIAIEQITEGTMVDIEPSNSFIVPATTVEKTTTEIQFATTWHEWAAHRTLASDFESEYPDVTVNVSRELDFARADCFAAPVTVLPRIESLLLPLDSFFELDPSVNPDDFYAGTFDQLKTNGQIIGLPAWINVPFIEYNRSLFAKLGIVEPTTNWTLTEFLQIAQALTDESIGRYGFVDWTQAMLEHGFTQFGINPFVPDETSGTTIDFAAAEPVILWYADLVRLHHIQPPLPGYLLDTQTTSERWDHFENMVAEEQVAMWVGSIANQALAERLTQAGVEVGIAPVPRGASGHNVNVADRVTAYYISTETPYRQLCWEWINFLSRQPTASTYLPARVEIAESTEFASHVGAERAAYLPAESELAGSAEFAHRVGTERTVAYRAALIYSHDGVALSATRSNWLAPGWIWLGIVYEQVAKEEAGINTALSEATRFFENYRACVIDNNAFTDQAEWRQCAIDADERLAERYGG
ncbi:MAG: extracellular solute-binding protein [Anaerolineae bacterium]|nr:extracellular solute-binding protein [Anaerolineae bacterium]